MAYTPEITFREAGTGPLELGEQVQATQRAKTWGAIIGATQAVASAVGQIQAKDAQDKKMADTFEATTAAQDYNNQYLSKLDGADIMATLDAKVAEIQDSEKSDTYKNVMIRKLIGYREGYGKQVADQEAAHRLKIAGATIADVYEASADQKIPLADMRAYVTTFIDVPEDQTDEALAIGAVYYANDEFTKAQSLESLDATKASIDKELSDLIGVRDVTQGTREYKVLTDAQQRYTNSYNEARKAIIERANLAQTKAEIASAPDVTTFINGDQISFVEPVPMEQYVGYLQNNGKTMAANHKSMVEHQKNIEAYKSNRAVLGGWEITDRLPISANKEQMKLAEQTVKNGALMSFMQGNSPRVQKIINTHPNVETGLGNHLLSGLNSPNVEDAIGMNQVVEAHLSTELGRKMLAKTMTDEQFSEMYLHVGMSRAFGPPQTPEEYRLRQEKITSATIAYKSHERVDKDTQGLIDEYLGDLPPQVAAPMKRVSKMLYHSGSGKELEKVLNNYRESLISELPSLDGNEIELYDAGNLKLAGRDQEVLGYVVSDVVNFIAKDKPYFDPEDALAITHPDGSVSFYNKSDPTVAIERVAIIDMIEMAATSPGFKRAMDEENSLSNKIMNNTLIGAGIKGTQNLVNVIADMEATGVSSANAFQKEYVDPVLETIEDILTPLVDYLEETTPKEGATRTRRYLR